MGVIPRRSRRRGACPIDAEAGTIDKVITRGRYSHVKATIVTSSNGLFTLQPETDLLITYKVKMANGIVEVAAKQSFFCFMSNFGAV